VEPAPSDIVFEGNLDEVNRFFYENDWSDGLPIVPPTPERVAEFLRWTDLSRETELGIPPARPAARHRVERGRERGHGRLPA
jgi:hypothetical protein